MKQKTKTKTNTKIKFLPLEDALKFTHKLNLKSRKEWENYCRNGKRPSNIPYNPVQVYGVNWNEWLNNNNTNHNLNKPSVPSGLVKTKPTKTVQMTYEQARKAIAPLKIKVAYDFMLLHAKGQIDKNIPIDPQKAYKNDGWISWKNFLGDHKSNGPVGPNKPKETDPKPTEPKKTTLKQAVVKQQVSKQTVKNSSDKNPNTKDFVTFENARKYMHNEKLESCSAWNKWSSTKRPSNIPSTPNRFYKNEWKGMSDFLGLKVESKKSTKTNTKIEVKPVTTTNKFKTSKYVSFSEAKRIIGKLNFNTSTEFYHWSKTDRPSNFPSTPSKYYANTGWKNWNDFLGNDFTWNKTETKSNTKVKPNTTNSVTKLNVLKTDIMVMSRLGKSETGEYIYLVKSKNELF